MTDLSVRPDVLTDFITANIQQRTSAGTEQPAAIEYAADAVLAGTKYELEAPNISAELQDLTEQHGNLSHQQIQGVLEKYGQ